MTVLAGDWLYMESFRIALGERNFRILDLLIGLTQTMVEGELLQLTTLGKVVDEAQALDIARRKTACLFSVSMQLAALLGGKNAEDEQRLASTVSTSAWRFRSSTTCSTSPPRLSAWASRW
jgi:octaprenyl-diphosphate synthase